MSFDTLSIARDLRAAELPAEQAEAIAAAIGRSVAEGAATKNDTDKLIARSDALECTMAAQMQALDAQITSKIDKRAIDPAYLAGRRDRRDGGRHHRGTQAVKSYSPLHDWPMARFIAANYIVACVMIILLRVLP